MIMDYNQNTQHKYNNAYLTMMMVMGVSIINFMQQTVACCDYMIISMPYINAINALWEA